MGEGIKILLFGRASFDDPGRLMSLATFFPPSQGGSLSTSCFVHIAADIALGPGARCPEDDPM